MPQKGLIIKRLRANEESVCIPIGGRTLSRVSTSLGMEFEDLLGKLIEKTSSTPSSLCQASC